MNSSNRNNISIVIEGFAILLVAHALGGYYVAPKIADAFPMIPMLTIAMLSSSAVSSPVAIVYLAIRTRVVPKIAISREMLIYVFLGIVASWFVAVTSILVFGKNIPFVQEILEIKYPYFFPTLFLLIVAGPVLEETLARGYFFEILKKSLSNVQAILFSSVLFVLPHGIWGVFDINLLFIFLYSVIFTYVYMRGGLIASIVVHAFVNLFLVYLNVGT